MIEPISPHPNTVYYSNFWYSRFYRPTSADFSGNIAQSELSLHKFRLRILSLFFEKIYIPRTHLITFRHRIQKNISRSIFEDKDFGFLFEHKKIVVSSFPGLDAKQDSDRIMERSDKTERVIYPDDPKYIDMIPITEVYEIDSLLESKSSSVSLSEYGDLISLHNLEISHKFLDILKRSKIPGIPFFHEEFISRLREEFEDETFHKIWRETNSIYLTTGGIGQNGIIPFFNEELESVNFRYHPNNIDRYLYSPTTLYTFLSQFLSNEELSEFIQGDIEKILGFFCNNPEGVAILKKFQDDYHRLVSIISYNTIPMNIAGVLEQPVLSEIFDMALNDRFRQGSKFLSALIDDAEKLSRAADVDGSGLIGGGLRAATRYGHGVLQSVSLRQRYAGIVDLTSVLKGHLGKGRRA